MAIARATHSFNHTDKGSYIKLTDEIKSSQTKSNQTIIYPSKLLITINIDLINFYGGKQFLKTIIR